MWPILTYAYYRLAMREEREVTASIGEKYARYIAMVPAFVPRLRKSSKEEILDGRHAELHVH